MKICQNDSSHTIDDAALKSGYCSECGGELIDPSQVAAPPASTQAVASTPLTAATPAPSGEQCPDCGTPREGSDRFCSCGYDFETKQSSQAPDPAAVSAQPGNSWVAVLSYDLTSPRAFRPSDADLAAQGVKPPTDTSERVFVLTGDNLPFARTSNVITVNDRGVSRKAHGEFVKQDDGSYGVKDAGTDDDMHGVYINGDHSANRVASAEVRKLSVGDKVLVGCWAVLTIQKR